MKKDLTIIALFDLYKFLLTDKQKEAVSQYYELDLSLSEIGENLGISRQAVKDSIDNSIKTLKNAEENLALNHIKTELFRAINSENSTKEILENLLKNL